MGAPCLCLQACPHTALSSAGNMAWEARPRPGSATYCLHPWERSTEYKKEQGSKSDSLRLNPGSTTSLLCALGPGP